jgi:hypothetical protein
MRKLNRKERRAILAQARCEKKNPLVLAQKLGVTLPKNTPKSLLT